MTVNAVKLIRMAEQITANMTYTDDVELVAARVADHLNRFWDPRMRRAIAKAASGGTDQLSPALEAAVRQLQGSLQPAPEQHAADAEGTPGQPLDRLQLFHGSAGEGAP